MSTKTINTSTEVQPRFVCGYYVAFPERGRVKAESKIPVLRGYIPVDALVLESARLTLGALISSYLDGADLVLSAESLDDCVRFIEQTDYLYLSARKDSRGIIRL